MRATASHANSAESIPAGDAASVPDVRQKDQGGLCLDGSESSAGDFLAGSLRV